MWKAYLKTIGETIENTDKTFLAWDFEITKEDVNNLTELVLNGQKEATAGHYGSKNMIMEKFQK